MLRFLILICLSLIVAPSYADAIIANPQLHLAKVISIEEARDIFLLKKTQSNGINIQIFLFPKEVSFTKQFLIDSLTITPTSYFDALDRFASEGKQNLPIIINSDIKMIISIENNSGGVGFIRDTSYIDPNNIDILIIK
jgi:hypothetical protein